MKHQSQDTNELGSSTFICKRSSHYPNTSCFLQLKLGAKLRRDGLNVMYLDEHCDEEFSAGRAFQYFVPSFCRIRNRYPMEDSRFHIKKANRHNRGIRNAIVETSVY